MIRVLFTINNLDTAGMKYVVADLARGLDRANFSPRLAVGRKTGSPLEQELEQVCPLEEIDLHLPRSPWRGFPAAAWGAACSLRGRVDIAHSFDYSSDWSEGLAINLAGLPWVVEKTNLSWGARRWWPRCFLARRIVCLSQAQADLLHAWRRKVSVIPIGIDLERFENARPFHRPDYGLRPEDVVLVSVAHLVPVKGHVELLQALACVAGELPDLQLLLAGYGEPGYQRELSDLAERLGVAGRVRFLGDVVQIPSLLKTCDGKILATRNVGRREAFGAALVEAMAAGLPVIATRSGGPEEIVVDGETGWLVDADGYQPLAAAMRLFYADPGRRRAFGEAGQRRAWEHYGKAQMISRYQALYQSLVG